MAKNSRTPQDVARRESELRRGGYDIYDGPSFVQAGKCFLGASGHGHLRDSTHFFPAGFGGAVDVGRDPAGGAAVSVVEKAHLDDLARALMNEDFRVIWGVQNHFDHLHFDFNVRGPGGGHQVVLQGPNAGFTVAHIVWVQKSLRKVRRPDGHRYYAGIVDGLREDRTVEAIKRFQSDHRLKDDGEPGRDTKDAIKAALASRQGDPEEPTGSGMATLAGTVPQTNKGADGTTARARIARFRVAGTSAADTAAAVERWVAPRGEGALLVARETPDLPVAAVAAARSGAVLLPVPAGKPLPRPCAAI